MLHTYELTLTRANGHTHTVRVRVIDLDYVYELLADPQEREFFQIPQTDRLLGADAIRRIN